MPIFRIFGALVLGRPNFLTSPAQESLESYVTQRVRAPP